MSKLCYDWTPKLCSLCEFWRFKCFIKQRQFGSVFWHCRKKSRFGSSANSLWASTWISCLIATHHFQYVVITCVAVVITWGVKMKNSKDELLLIRPRPWRWPKDFRPTTSRPKRCLNQIRWIRPRSDPWTRNQRLEGLEGWEKRDSPKLKET